MQTSEKCLYCGGPLKDAEYADYLLCSAECDLKADSEFEDFKQGDIQ